MNGIRQNGGAAETGTWSVYLLLCTNSALYCGISNAPARRFAAHLSGKGARFTRMHKPLAMRLAASNLSRSAAARMEAHIKTWPRTRKETLWHSLPDFPVGTGQPAS
ncbi:GIY-YIG nuclease family protein [Neisseria leonii]|uniref:GIY-YIG nuclease family protein n=1 Tax=Neisseria leonii TaxID=2995413 RepID=UPI00237B3160|nr:GIY-YIG nuclease family protein [Neisseria sp. 3986]MDD9325760.1 GIY-YIG nuclease family protein [Neisseria sp. 3986]